MAQNEREWPRPTVKVRARGTEPRASIWMRCKAVQGADAPESRRRRLWSRLRGARRRSSKEEEETARGHGQPSPHLPNRSRALAPIRLR